MSNGKKYKETIQLIVLSFFAVTFIAINQPEYFTPMIKYMLLLLISAFVYLNANKIKRVIS